MWHRACILSHRAGRDVSSITGSPTPVRTNYSLDLEKSGCFSRIASGPWLEGQWAMAFQGQVLCEAEHGPGPAGTGRCQNEAPMGTDGGTPRPPQGHWAALPGRSWVLGGPLRAVRGCSHYTGSAPTLSLPHALHFLGLPQSTWSSSRAIKLSTSLGPGS